MISRTEHLPLPPNDGSWVTYDMTMTRIRLSEDDQVVLQRLSEGLPVLTAKLAEIGRLIMSAAFNPVDE